MATLDDKILDGPNVCYCSDSDEDEKGDLRFCASTPECNVSARMPPSQGGSTGPKGVLADYRNYQRQKLIDQVNAEKEFLKEAKRFTLEEAGNHSSHEDEEEDELATIRLRRLEQLKNYTRGRVVEIANSEQFLQVTDSDSPNLVFVHIYRDGLEAVGVLNEALLEIAARSDSNDTKFYKVKATTLGTSVNFAENALPALQIYDKGNLVGNFVRITDELGEDFNGQSLCKFLEKRDIYVGRN